MDGRPAAVSWGCPAGEAVLQHHLRTLNMARIPAWAALGEERPPADGRGQELRPVMFRHWDSRVVGTLIPALDHVRKERKGNSTAGCACRIQRCWKSARITQKLAVVWNGCHHELTTPRAGADRVLLLSLELLSIALGRSRGLAHLRYALQAAPPRDRHRQQLTMDAIITDDERRELQKALGSRSDAIWTKVASENSRDGKEPYHWLKIEGAHQVTQAAQQFMDTAEDFVRNFGGVEFMADFLQVTPTSVVIWDQLVDREIRSGTFRRILGLRPAENKRRRSTVFDRDI